MIIDDGSLLSISASDLDADGVLRVPDGVYEIAQNVGVRLWQSSYNMSAGIRPQGFFYLLDRHAPLAMTKGSKCIIPQSLCHSRAGGNRAWVVISYLIWGIIQRYIFYSPAILSTNLIDPIPACAGMTKIIAKKL